MQLDHLVDTSPEPARLFGRTRARATRRVETATPSARGGRVREWLDAIIASDPGLVRLFAALQVMLAIGITIAVAYVFLKTTHLMWIEAPDGVTLPADQLAMLAAQHHGVTVLAMMLSGIIALMTVWSVNESTPKQIAITMLPMPIPMLATMMLGIELAPHRSLAMVTMALVMGLGVYLRKFVVRFGPRVVLYGMLLFNGYLTGFMSGNAISKDQIGEVALILWIAVGVNVLFKIVVSLPIERGRVMRMVRSFEARAQKVIGTAIQVIDARDERERERARKRLHTQMLRLNEVALVIDASLTGPGMLPRGVTPAAAHDELFAIELAVQNVGRTIEQLADAELPVATRLEIRDWLNDLRAGRSQRAAENVRVGRDSREAQLATVSEHDRMRVHRLATAIEDWANLRATWEVRRTQLAETETFASPVRLVMGNLPGSSLVSTKAAAGAGGRATLAARLHLDPPAQLAIRVMLGVGLASLLGSLLDERRFYWAVMAVFVAFLGANTAHEQATKAANRVIGTAAGIVIGSLLAHLIGASFWSIIAILLAVGFSMYFGPISYIFMTIGFTVGLSQLYEELGQYSDSLLMLRFEETLLGAAVAALVAFAIFPVHARHAAHVAMAEYVDALVAQLDAARDWLRGRDDARLTAASRALDAANQQLLATIRPLTRLPFRRARLEDNLGFFSYAAHQASNLAADLVRLDRPEPALVAELSIALDGVQQRVGRLQGIVAGDAVDVTPTHTDEVLTAALDRTSTQGDARGVRVLRDLDRLDEIITELRDSMIGREVTGIVAPAAVRRV